MIGRYWSLGLVRLLADGNLETTKHESFPRIPMTNMPPITVFTHVSHHRLEMTTFFLEMFGSIDSSGFAVFHHS